MKTKITDVAVTSKPAPGRRPKGSMADAEAAHGAPGVDPQAVKRKAAKDRIDPEKYGVEVTGAPEADEPKKRK